MSGAIKVRIKMRSYWVRVALNPMTVFIKEKRTYRDQEKKLMMTETEIGVVSLH